MKRRLNLSVGHAGISSANMATMSRDENIIDIEIL